MTGKFCSYRFKVIPGRLRQSVAEQGEELISKLTLQPTWFPNVLYFILNISHKATRSVFSSAICNASIIKRISHFWALSQLSEIRNKFTHFKLSHKNYRKMLHLSVTCHQSNALVWKNKGGNGSDCMMLDAKKHISKAKSNFHCKFMFTVETNIKGLTCITIKAQRLNLCHLNEAAAASSIYWKHILYMPKFFMFLNNMWKSNQTPVWGPLWS